MRPASRLGHDQRLLRAIGAGNSVRGRTGNPKGGRFSVLASLGRRICPLETCAGRLLVCSDPLKARSGALVGPHSAQIALPSVVSGLPGAFPVPVELYMPPT